MSISCDWLVCINSNYRLFGDAFGVRSNPESIFFVLRDMVVSGYRM